MQIHVNFIIYVYLIVFMVYKYYKLIYIKLLMQLIAYIILFCKFVINSLVIWYLTNHTAIHNYCD
jgi:hypothetical protein